MERKEERNAPPVCTTNTAQPPHCTTESRVVFPSVEGTGRPWPPFTTSPPSNSSKPSRSGNRLNPCRRNWLHCSVGPHQPHPLLRKANAQRPCSDQDGVEESGTGESSPEEKGSDHTRRPGRIVSRHEGPLGRTEEGCTCAQCPGELRLCPHLGTVVPLGYSRGQWATRLWRIQERARSHCS